MTGDELKKLRIKAQLSQADLASLLGVKQPRVSDWESGARLIPEYINKMIECLKRAGEL